MTCCADESDATVTVTKLEMFAVVVPDTVTTPPPSEQLDMELDAKCGLVLNAL
jgi:hypothetical protein